LAGLFSGPRLKAVTLALPSTSIAWVRAFLEPPLVKNRRVLKTYLAGARAWPVFRKTRDASARSNCVI
jgi:hypothetical protein